MIEHVFPIIPKVFTFYIKKRNPKEIFYRSQLVYIILHAWDVFVISIELNAFLCSKIAYSIENDKKEKSKLNKHVTKVVMGLIQHNTIAVTLGALQLPKFN